MTGGARDHDIIIVGGGINGAGIARDAASRGLRVLLLEQDDFGSGTSSSSSRLIHGGLRYLEHGELSLVYESLHERRRLLQLAPHLVVPIPISIPVYRSSRRGMWLLRFGMVAYDLLSLGKKLARHRMLTRDEFLRHAPGVNPEGLRGGAEYFDAQVTFAERLVIENIVAANHSGAVVRNYCRVTGLEVHKDGRKSVRYVDATAGDESVAHAALIVNAAGPWVDRVLSTADAKLPRLMGGTKGSHVVVSAFDGAPRGAVYVEAAADGRPIFIIPWNGQVLIGTTDIRYDGDPARAMASREEAQYLLAETNRIFPAARLGLESIHYAYAGIRPLPWRSKGPESAITRRHIIRRHRADEAPGLMSIIGGKLTTYRNLSEQVTDRLVRMLGKRNIPCATRDEPLPGARDLDAARARLACSGVLSDKGRERLLRIYGGRALQVLDLAARNPGLDRALDTAGTIHAAEIAFCIRFEFARSLVDIMHRRTMLGLSADLGRSHAASVAVAATAELGWDQREAERQLAGLEAHNTLLTIPSA